MASSYTPQDSAILLIDHQDMTVGWINSHPRETCVNNVRMLARIGEELGVPLLVTSTMEDQIGTNIKDIQELAPAAYGQRIKRGGTLNTFLDSTRRRRPRSRTPEADPRRSHHRYLPVSLRRRSAGRRL